MPIQSKQQPPYYTTENNAKIYRALLTQTSTNAPEAIILQNTYNATPIWTRDGTGSYIITLNDAFTEDKTWMTLSGTAGLEFFNLGPQPNAINLQIYDDSGTPADDFLVKTPILIITFP